MADYYFDIETAHKVPNDPNERANLEPDTGKIITIQYCRIDRATGSPVEPLTVLKEWGEDASNSVIGEDAVKARGRSKGPGAPK